MKSLRITQGFYVFIGMMMLTFGGCKKERGSSQFGIIPQVQADFTNIALNIDGKLTSGSMPSPSSTGGTNLSISAPFTLLELSGGTSLHFPITTTNDHAICKVYLQVKGAESYWETEVVRDSFGQLSVAIFIPKIVQNNQFPIAFSVADCNGNVSQPETTTISITDHPTLIQGANGTPRFNLQFSSQDVDFDLHVKTPLGNIIYFDNPSGDNGVLDFDCVCCSTPSENIFWAPGTAPTGTYEYWVHFYGDCGGSASSYILRVYNNNDIVRLHTGTLSAVGSNSIRYAYVYP